MFAGNALPKGAAPYAQAYAGHQFGHFTMLGDGRALMWGEHIAPDGRRWDIQFKGSGRTPYSRGGDGRAALGPMLREYVISEALHALGIPTTRALAVATTGQAVHRDEPLDGAVLTRVARSHIRVGTFQYAAMQDDPSVLRALLSHTIARHDPELACSKSQAEGLLHAVIARQASLIVEWMRVGFIHGVMNTDNMTLSGETIDYGPCAFMDAYNPQTVFSSIDHAGRYAYAKQPHIAQWNIARLAEALLPLIDEDTKRAVVKAREVVETFAGVFQGKWLAMMRAKIGLADAQDGDAALIGDLLRWMQTSGTDFTKTFRDLSRPGLLVAPTAPYDHPAFRGWYTRWQTRRARDGGPCPMRTNNPRIIPRNHIVEEALGAATAGDMQPLHDLLAALQDPYTDRPGLERYQSPPPPSRRVYQTFCGT